MKKIKLVCFLLIEYEVCEEMLYVGFDISLVFEGIILEEVYVGNLFEYIKVYWCLIDGEDVWRGFCKCKIV